MKINIQFIWNTLNYSSEVYLAATLGKYNSQSSLNKAAHRNLVYYEGKKVSVVS